MKKFFFLKWLRNISIARKLYFTVGIMGLLIATELGTMTFAIKTLSSVRAYVGAEGLWSKAEKDAAYTLQKYGRSHNENDYLEYLNFLKVSLGDSKYRMELMKKHPDLHIAREGLLEGRVHPDDIDGAIKLFTRFSNIYYIHKAIVIWAKGDSLMSQLIATGEELHKEITATNSSPERITAILNKIDPINDNLTKLEDEFSYTLGAGSRWLASLILKLLLGIVLTVEICGLSLTIIVSRGIAKGLNEIILSADKIAAGNFRNRAKVFSEDEIGILARSFNDMAEKLERNINALIRSEDNLKISKNFAEQSLSVKEHFLANMSHEIRTPMNAVMGFTTLLEHSNLDERQHEIVHAMKISGQTLMTIINDILDYSKIESGRMVIEQIPFSVRKIFESLQVLLQQKATEKKLTLIFDVDKEIPETLIGDPTRLMQILLNLSDNAVKFTEKGSVEISVTGQNSDDNTVTLQFQVKDTGEGIPEDKFPEIFERFTQVSAETTRKHGGTGLGLSIVKSLVELQNGTISVTSEPGEGSVFSFILTYPKAKPEQEISSLPLKQPPAEHERQLHILLAEDNKINQMLVLHVLKKYGISCDVADNGKIATEKMKEKKYDLILMDIQMPEMDGYDATRIIRNEFKSNIPIVALTAHAMNEEREKCLKLGMNDFISKPFDQKHLYDTIIGLCS